MDVTMRQRWSKSILRTGHHTWVLLSITTRSHSEMEATGISAQALMALRPGCEDTLEKHHLASPRQTMQVEDAAYSLFGIFSLSLPVTYGERDKGLDRLLAQLLTSSWDMSILPWTGRSGNFNGCLPPGTSVFSWLPTSHIPQPSPTPKWESLLIDFARSTSPCLPGQSE